MNIVYIGSCVLGYAIVIALASVGVRKLDERQHARQERANPTKLILTIVDEEQPPSVCVFDVATETLIGDTVRVVVNRAPCPALAK